MSMNFDTDVNVLTGKKLKVESKPVTRNIVVGTNEDTWAKMYAVLNTMEMDEIATICVYGNRMNTFTGGVISDKYAYGLIYRYSSSRFDMQLNISNTAPTLCRLKDVSSSARTFQYDEADIIVNFSKSNTTISGSDTSAGTTTIDCSSYIPSGYSIYSVQCCILDGSYYYALPWFSDTPTDGRFTRINVVGGSTFTIKNKATWSANTTICVTLFLHK